ncbi:MAG TPA: DUF3857 domain-containing transglutaminase family protein [Opitutaceae bacterium]|jgi:hypothetical protein
MSEAVWEQVGFADPAAWVRSENYEPNVPAMEGSQVTILWWSRQVQAELGVAFHATAKRLETATAVQHESQWSLSFNPECQRVQLHWLRTVRSGLRTDHLQKNRMRLLQRETKLEQHVLDGNWTLVAVLDDVRVGDVVEAAFSIYSLRPLTQGRCEVFFSVPSNLVVGRYSLQVLFASTRTGMIQRASADLPTPQIAAEESMTRWAWSGSQLSQEVRAPEPNLPANALDFRWVQVSDWANWEALSTQVARAWTDALADDADSRFSDFPRPATIDRATIVQLVRRIQDEFRYLSVPLDSGGWIPADAGTTCARRYGDCKDLAWFAVTILRQWGVAARPILVGSHLKGKIRDLLPMTLMFDHALLEVAFDNVVRWFDLTARNQGGDFEHMPVGHFGAGLPVEVAAKLSDQPGGLPINRYAVLEKFFLSGRPGDLTFVEQAHCVEGVAAEDVRKWHSGLSVERFSEERQNMAVARFGKAARMGQVVWREDREANTCEWIERYLLPDVVSRVGGSSASFVFPRFSVWDWLALPEDKPRRAPWAIPHGVDCRHTIQVHHPSLLPVRDEDARWENDEILLTIDRALRAGSWTVTARLFIKASEVPAGGVRAYRTLLVDFGRRLALAPLFDYQAGRIAPPAGSPQLLPAPRTVDDYVPAKPAHEFAHAAIGGSWRSSGLLRRNPKLALGLLLPLLWLVWVLVQQILLHYAASG